MNIRRTARSGPAFGLALLLALAHMFLLPAEAEAQVLDQLRQQGQQARQQVEERLDDAVRCAFDDSECVEKAKAEQKPVVLTDNEGKVLTDEDGKLIKDTEQLPAGMQTQAAQADGSRPAQQAAQEPLEDGRFTASFTVGANVHRHSGVAWVNPKGTLWLCPEEAGVRPDRPGMIYADLSKAEEGRYALGVGGRVLVTRQMPAPIRQRTASAPRDGSNMTITNVSDRLIVGAFEARYRDGVLAAQFRATIGSPPAGFDETCRRTDGAGSVSSAADRPEPAAQADQKQEVLTDKEGEGLTAELKAQRTGFQRVDPQQAQADQADAGPPAQQASPGVPEDGRYIATYTQFDRADPHGPKIVQHFTGRAFIRPTYGGRFSIDLCDESPLVPRHQRIRKGGARIDVFMETGSVQEGTYSAQLYVARPGTSGPLSFFRTGRAIPQPALTITSVSDGEIAGVITAGGFVRNFEAQFRARDTTSMSDEERREFQAFADAHCR